MISLLRSLVSDRPTRIHERASAWPQDLTIDQVTAIIQQGGFIFPFAGQLRQPREDIPGDYLGLINGIFRANPIAFAAIVVRMQVFAQARFRFRRFEDGQPGQLFGTRDLRLIERPEPTMATSDLLKRASLDADLAGNWFGVRRPDRIKRVRPDWAWLVLASRRPDGEIGDVDTEVVGLIHQPGGRYSDSEPEAFAVGEFAHFAPIPDPAAWYRGMSWLTPIIREAQADSAMTTHKLQFLENAATPNLMIKLPPGLDKAKAEEWIEIFEQDHTGALNAFRNVYLSAGWDVETVGKDMEQIDFKAVQGASETRISVAARVPAVLLGVSEGLQGSSLNTGNYGAAKRSFADTTMRDLWKDMSASLETILPPPPGSAIWYDEQWIPFLAEDAKDGAAVLNQQSQAIRTLTDGGFKPDSVVEAVMSGDLGRLVHSGKLSVQLQEPGTEPEPPQARADSLPGEVRCSSCSRLLAEMATAPYRFTCPRCKAVAEAA